MAPVVLAPCATPSWPSTKACEGIPFKFALATGAVTTDRTPAVSAVTATSEIRLRSVVFDIFFLSLVRFRNFLNLARRSFDPLIPFPCGTHV